MKRIGMAVPTLLAVATIIFLFIRLAGGDPAIAALGEFGSQDAVERLRSQMGLDRPLIVQYGEFIGGLLRGDLGASIVTNYPMSERVAQVLPHTLQLTFSGLLIGLMIGIPLGLASAFFANRTPDSIARLVSLAGLSMPAFVLGIVLIYVFAVNLHWLPSGGSASLWSDPINNVRTLILPALTLGVIATAYVTRMTRSAVRDVLNEDYQILARARGLSGSRIVLRHALRPALVPIVSLLSVFAISLLGSSVMTEIVFDRPGLGRAMVGAMQQRDYNALQAIMVVFAGLVIAIVILTDILYTLVDPRIKLKGGRE